MKKIRVADPDPYWIRTYSLGYRIRIQVFNRYLLRDIKFLSYEKKTKFVILKDG